MKIKLKIGYTEKITFLYLVLLAVYPVFAKTEAALNFTYTPLFISSPFIFLLYATPVFLYLFLRTVKMEETSKCVHLGTFSAMSIILTNDILYSRNSQSAIMIAVLVLSILCINFNDTTKALILLPGLFLTKLGLPFILIAYIPVLLLLCIKSMPQQSESNKKTSPIFFYAYFYIAVLLILLTVSGHISLSLAKKTMMFSFNTIVKIVAGAILVLLSSAHFILKTAKYKKQLSSAQKLAVFLFAVYPLVFSAIGTVFNITTISYTSTFYTAFMMYLAGNLQLDLIFGKSDEDKIKNEKIIFAVIVISLCVLCFS